MTITATHIIQDPISGLRTPTIHAIEHTSLEFDERALTDSLMDLFRQFDLPNGGTLVIEGYGKRIEWDYDGFLVPLARRLLN